MDTDGQATVHMKSRMLAIYPCGSVCIRGSVHWVLSPKVRNATDVFDPTSLSVVSFADRVACTLLVGHALLNL